MTRIRVDFIADLSCPWCYVAWGALERAIAARPDLTVERRWSAYLLRPDTPRHGIDRAETLARIYAGAPEKARASRAALEAAALDAGVPIALEAARIFPATIDGHRLIHWAGGQERTAAAVDALFAAYHVDGRDIGDPDVLVDIADGIGLDGKIVADLLRSEADWNAVADAHNDALEAGVRGVPVTIFNRRIAHQGAESVAGYAMMLDRVVA
jgi:predicted DsbA family dithiol-disulfide isomerase